MTDPAPTRDWLVTFARKVAQERATCAEQPGRVFTVMLRQNEAEGVLKQVEELVIGVRDDPPGVLYDADGEIVFVPADSGESEKQARALALAEGTNTKGMEASVVWMLPVPEHFVVDESWWCVHEGTLGAVRFWRFRL